MHTQYSVQNKRLDFHFPEHKHGIEIDKYGHVGRDFEYKQSIPLMIAFNSLVVKLLELIQMLQILSFTD